MKVVSLALLYLGSVSFFGVEAAKLDIATDFKRKWSSWRVQRNEPVALTAAQAAAMGGGKRPAGRSQAAADEKPALTAGQAAARGKRTARSLDSLRGRRNSLPNAAVDLHVHNLRELCGFGTCTVHNLAHLIHHYLDKDKDVSAPPERFGPQGYGRRRRRSLLDAAASTSKRHTSTLLERIIEQNLQQDKDKDVSPPPEMLGPQGYGRRRRRVDPAAASTRRRSARTASRLLASLREGGLARALAQP